MSASSAEASAPAITAATEKDAVSPLVLAWCFGGVVLATACVALLPSVGPPQATADEGGMVARLFSPRMNLRRKLQHVTSGLLILFLYARVVTHAQSSALLLLAAGCLYVVHRLRLVYPVAQRALLAVFGSLIRPHELYQLPGAFWLLLGCGLCIRLFALQPPVDPSSDALFIDIPALCMLCLSIGDPLASFVGLLLGTRDRWRVGGKSLLAAALAAFVCTLACQQWITWQQCSALTGEAATSCITTVSRLRGGEIWLWAIVASIAGALCEFFDVADLDDNFRIPLGAGCILWLAEKLLART